MQAGVVKAVAAPELIKKLALGAYSAEASTPAELKAFLAADTAKWSAIIKSAGLKIN